MVEEELNCISGKKSSLNRSMLCSDNSLSLIEIILQPKKNFNANFLIVPVVLWLKMHLSFFCVCLTTKPRPSNFRSKYAKILTLFFLHNSFYDTNFSEVFVFQQRRIFTNIQSNFDKYFLKRNSHITREKEMCLPRWSVCGHFLFWSRNSVLWKFWDPIHLMSKKYFNCPFGAD